MVHRKKWGFGIPIDKWFVGKRGKDRLASLLDADSPLNTVLDGKKIERRLSGYRGTMYEANILWTLLSLKVWMELFLKRTQWAS